MFSRSRAHHHERLPNTVMVAERPAPPRGASAPSVIDAELRINGDVTIDGELKVDGRIDGNVQARILTIGMTGHVNGHARADELVIHGFLAGSVNARRVHLTNGCRVMADVTHEVLCIDEGAVFDGRCQKTTPIADEDQDELYLTSEAAAE